MLEQDKQQRQQIEELKSKKKGFITAVGTVEELLPNASFKVILENDHEVLAYLSGKMRMFKIKILPGDKVLLEMTPYDLKRARVIRRL